MKLQIRSIFFLLLLNAAILNAEEKILLTDDFTAPDAGNSSDINDGLDKRQAGTQAPQSWTFNAGGGAHALAEVGNTNESPSTESNPDGNYLLLGGQAQAALADLILSSDNVDGVLEISFEMFRGSGDIGKWTSFTLTPFYQPGYGLNRTGFPVQNASEAFGMLVRRNGEIRVWGGNFDEDEKGEALGIAASENFKIVITDSEETGSGFAGNGAKVIIFNDGLEVGSRELHDVTTLLMSWGTSDSQVSGIDNLKVSVRKAGGN